MPEDDEVTLEQLMQMVDEPPIIRVINLILSQAINDRATAIHIEPRAGPSRVLYRVDGILYDVMHPPRHVHLPCACRLKIMANMDIAERRIPQDGRIRLTHDGREFDLRVCSLPCAHGEKLVVKIHSAEPGAIRPLEGLGMSPAHLTALQGLLARPHGLLLVSGGRGTGKSTTLYSCLAHLKESQRDLFSIEDPIEHHLENVNQLQVRPKVGLTFAQALRACLRSDPDVIMVADLHNEECCRLAVDAACDRHLVLAATYSDSASWCVQRLMNVGVEPYLVSHALLGASYQRLARRICSACKQPVSGPNDFQLSETWEGAGCDECKQRGCKGQVPLFELLQNTPDLAQLILERAGQERIREQALRDGMIPLRQDGLHKVQQGLVSLSECLRIVRDD